MKRLAVLFPALTIVLLITSCGGSSSSGAAPSGVQNRAFLSNTYAGNLQVMDTQNDTTAYTAETTNSAGQVIPGSPVTITAGNSVTFEVESPDMATTLIYDQSDNGLIFLTNSTEVVANEVFLSAPTGMALFTPDNSTVYAPLPNAPIINGPLGGVAKVNVAAGSVSVIYSVPAARYIALSPSGQYLLAFAANSDSVFLLNLNAGTVKAVQIPGFSRPVNAFFSSDSNTAYVLNCGPECGSAGPASVSRLDIPSQTIKATVNVAGATVGYLNNSTLYVAGTPGTNGSFDAVNISNMTRVTSTPLTISDGYHTTMALNHGKLYIGAITCSNTTSGCLSVVNINTLVADPPLPPHGPVTGMLSITNRNTMYVIEGGYLRIYDTTTDTLGSTQIIFHGALSDVVQVDPF